MAADLTKTPIVVTSGDIPQTIPFSIDIQQLRWVGADAGDTIQITDPAGNPIWADAAAVNAYVGKDDKPRYCAGGVIVSVMGSGTLYINDGPERSY